MRVFIGVKPSETVLSATSLASSVLCEALATSRVPCRPIDPAQIHLTLHFLGHLEEERIADLHEILSEARRFPKTEQRFDEWVFFPRRDRASICGLGASVASPQLLLVQESVQKALVANGFEVEDRPFVPHLTVARFKTPLGVGNPPSFVPFSFPVESLTLYKSYLGGTGSRYEILEEFPFA